MTYAVQYTISVLEGAYAQKYSVVIYDALRLEGLLRASKSPLIGFAAKGDRREYDPYECFQHLMKVLKRDAKRAFCASIVLTQENGETTRADRFVDRDASGEFELCAYGFEGICRRGQDESSFDEIEGTLGHYKPEMTTVMAVFREDLMGLLNLCEECMAKDARLVARVVPNDTPKPPALFQL